MSEPFEAIWQDPPGFMVVEDYSQPKYIWCWDFFGNKAFVLRFPGKISLWQRLTTRILFGSKWTREKQ